MRIVQLLLSILCFMPYMSFAMLRSTVPMASLVSAQKTNNLGSLNPDKHCLFTIKKIKQMFDENGNEKYMIGESVTQKEHACQAAHIAYIAGANPHSIAAAALHDIGNFLGDSVGDAQKVQTTHAERGAQWLEEQRFPPSVFNFARLHTYAKVWLCQQEPGYFERHLSRTSQESYHAQKEQFTNEEEVHHILSEVDLPTILALRRCDDMAKYAGVEPYDLGIWAMFMQNALLGYTNKPTHDDWKNRAAILQEIQAADPEGFIRGVYGGEQDRIEYALCKR